MAADRGQLFQSDLATSRARGYPLVRGFEAKLCEKYDYSCRGAEKYRAVAAALLRTKGERSHCSYKKGCGERGKLP